jgi:hypothetical protein
MTDADSVKQKNETIKHTTGRWSTLTKAVKVLQWTSVKCELLNDIKTTVTSRIVSEHASWCVIRKGRRNV